MARFRTDGLDALIEDMTRMGQSFGELADKMLYAGAEKVKQGWKMAIRIKQHIDTGSMLDNVNYPRKVNQIGDIRSVDIYPQGKDKKGTRNAEKAFILHYGTSKKPGTHFVDDADEISGPLVEEELTGIYDRWLKENGMGD